MDGFTVDKARSGDISARAGKKRIHSVYDPKREAERFVLDFLDSIKKNASVIIIGAGLGYIGRELAEKRPDVRIISCYLSTNLYRQRIDHGSESLSWYPDGGKSPEDFFFDVIEEQRLPGLRMLEWPPSIDAAQEHSARLRQALSTVVRRYSGNISTTAAFGRLWIRNTIRNFTALERIARPGEGCGATVLAAAGPSLEGLMEDIVRYRENFELWALPSALRALCRWGIKPDLVFSTDPGHWARIHSRWFPDAVPVAMPLSAAPRPEARSPALLLSQKTIGEEELFGEDSWYTVRIPQAGTVAISAIETWRMIGNGPLVLLGLDLCWFDLRGHVRPHSFDSYLSEFDQRTCPALTTQWLRALRLAPKRRGKHRSSYSLETYADWFRSANFSGEVYRIKTSEELPLDGVNNTDSRIFRNLPPIKKRTFEIIQAPINEKERRERINNLLQSWNTLARRGIPQNEREVELMYAIDPRGVLHTLQSDEASKSSVWEEHRRRFEKYVRDLLYFHEH